MSDAAWKPGQSEMTRPPRTAPPTRKARRIRAHRILIVEKGDHRGMLLDRKGRVVPAAISGCSMMKGDNEDRAARLTGSIRPEG
jgi:hypothetical protein